MDKEKENILDLVVEKLEDKLNEIRSRKGEPIRHYNDFVNHMLDVMEKYFPEIGLCDDDIDHIYQLSEHEFQDAVLAGAEPYFKANLSSWIELDSDELEEKRRVIDLRAGRLMYPVDYKPHRARFQSILKELQEKAALIFASGEGVDEFLSQDVGLAIWGFLEEIPFSDEQIENVTIVIRDIYREAFQNKDNPKEVEKKVLDILDMLEEDSIKIADMRYKIEYPDRPDVN